MTWDAVLWAALIFTSRVVDVGLGTVRVQLIVRRRKWLAAAIGFVEILIYILIVSRVIQEIGNWLNVIAYAGGFAAGTLVGMAISERMNRGVVEVTTITHGAWQELEDAVREAGFALTRHSGVGREGRVEVLTVVCSARDVSRLVDVVTRVDPSAFVYTRELAGLRGGYVYGVKSKL
ncbi:MAG: DUF2179 domain-containing protein [Chloroflexia bacterium]